MPPVDLNSTPQPRRARHKAELTDDEIAAIHDAVAALPPMTDEQIDGIAEVILAARERRRRARNPDTDTTE